MRIAFFTDAFLPFINGVSVAVWGLARSLADRGHEIHVIAPVPGRRLVLDHPNVHLKQVQSVPGGLFYPGLRLAHPFNEKVHRYCEEHRFDLIHFHTPLGLGRMARAVAKRQGLPLVGTYHTSVESREYRAHWRMHHSLFDDGMRFYIDSFYRHCDLVTFPSSPSRDRLRSLGLDYPARVISNGIELNKFPEVDPSEIKARFPGKIVLSLGRVAQDKNLMFLLEAWPRLADGARLIIIGGGPQEFELREYAKREGLRNIHFLGMIPHEELILSGYHRAADVFVMTSMIETQGLALMEAQANGLPSVGVNAGGTRDLIVDGENGYLVEPGDQDGFVEAVRRLLEDDALRDRMRAATLREIQKHDLRNVAGEWEEIYEELLARGGSPR